MRYYIIAVLALALGIGVFLHTILYSNSWQHREKARVDLERLEADNEVAEERLRALRSQINAMHNRPEVQRRAVRHELGYIGRDEIVLELGGER